VLLSLVHQSLHGSEVPNRGVCSADWPFDLPDDMIRRWRPAVSQEVTAS